MPTSLLADQALDLVTRHPLPTAAFAVAAGLLSWLLTRTRGPV
jgi:hypothetical protein